MKINQAMKRVRYSLLHILFFCSILTTGLIAQDEPMAVPEDKPVKSTFNSIWIFDNPSVMVPIKGTFEWDIQHRFGLVDQGYEYLFGLYAPANIRLGFAYVPIEKLMVGFGLTRTNLTWDLNAKYAIFRQTQSGSSPVSLTYYVNAAIDTREKDFFTNPDDLVVADRVSYFHQLALARKFSERFSFQVAASISHFNTVDAVKGEGDEVIDKWKNDHLAIAGALKYKVTDAMNILINYDHPLTTHDILDPQPNLSFGVEFNTSSHSFQFFAGNNYNITPQRNNVFNTNQIGEGEFLIGFNISRLWNF